MRVTDHTWVTNNRASCSPSQVATSVETLLDNLGLDWWNGRFVIRVTIDVPDPKPVAKDDGE